MANVVKHGFTNPIADDPALAGTKPSHWNAEHTFAGGSEGYYLRYTAAESDNVSWENLWEALGFKNIKRAPYSAVGDGVTDDTATIQAAIDSGGDIYFPPGTYLCSSKLTNTTGSPLTLHGSGRGVTVLRFTNTNGGLDLNVGNTANGHRALTVKDLSLESGSVGSGVALSITYPNLSSNSASSYFISNIEIRSNNYGTNYWNKGILLTDAWIGVVNNIWIIGNPSNRTLSTHGIHLLGNSIDTRIANVWGYHLNTGIEIGGAVEGVNIDHSSLVNVNYGIDFNTALGEPGNAISFTHVQSYLAGIILNDRTDLTIQGNLLYRFSGTNSDWAGIKSRNTGAGCTWLTIDANRIAGVQSAGGYTGHAIGIDLDLCQYSTVSDNILTDCENGIVLEAGAQNNHLTGNRGTTFVGQLLLDLGTNNELDYNAPHPPAPTLAINSATPRLDRRQHQMLVTANTNPTSITSFTNTYDGMVVTIRCADANTTIVHGANIKLAGSVDFVMGAGDTLTLLAATSSVFYEIGRMEA